jgi:hypothetical protein
VFNSIAPAFVPALELAPIPCVGTLLRVRPGGWNTGPRAKAGGARQARREKCPLIRHPKVGSALSFGAGPSIAVLRRDVREHPAGVRAVLDPDLYLLDSHAPDEADWTRLQGDLE